MSKQFYKLRKKTRFAAIITAVILGVGIGMIAVAAFVFATKAMGKPMLFGYYLSCAAAMLITSAVFYLIFMPSEKGFAKRLDTEHGLKEKVRTMVEFKESDDPFKKLQREDAEEKLTEIKAKHWRKKQLICAFVVFAISVGSLIFAFVVQGKADKIDPEAPIDEFSKEWILTELSSIKDYVDESLMQDELKEKTSAELEILINFVKEHDYLSEMKLQAIENLIVINREVKKENTAVLISEGLLLSEYPDLVDLGNAFAKFSISAVRETLDKLQKSLGGMSDTEAKFVAEDIRFAINESSAETNNTLVMLMNNLAAGLESYSSSGGNSLDSVFGTVAADAMLEVSVQDMNKRVCSDVNNKICELFGISQSDLVEAGADEDIDLTSPSEGSSSAGGGDDEEKDDVTRPPSSGSPGSGETEYGSDDLIYDPEDNTYKKYGEILNDYKNLFEELLDDGQYSGDIGQFIKEYFEKLQTPEED